MAEAFRVRKPSAIRKIIAARMSDAAHTIPHFRLTAELEVDALLEMRKELRAEQGAQIPSLNAFLIKACAGALTDVPEINIQWVDGEIRQFDHADIAVVTALDDGLATPIVRGADFKSVWTISQEAKELARRAGANALKMHEISGGSFSISNLGMYGVDQFDAIINPPQCAILAVARAKPSLVMTPKGEARVATLMRVTLSVDHRAADGVVGARFLEALRGRIARPDWMLAAATPTADLAVPSAVHL